MDRTAPRDATRAASRSRRMSYTERRALELLASLEARIEALNGVLADPDLYELDRARFDATSSALAAAREELTAAEEQWLALEMRRKEIEGLGSGD